MAVVSYESKFDAPKFYSFNVNTHDWDTRDVDKSGFKNQNASAYLKPTAPKDVAADPTSGSVPAPESLPVPVEATSPEATPPSTDAAPQIAPTVTPPPATPQGTPATPA